MSTKFTDLFPEIFVLEIPDVHNAPAVPNQQEIVAESGSCQRRFMLQDGRFPEATSREIDIGQIARREINTPQVGSL
jgi:hypothetical protein